VRHEPTPTIEPARELLLHDRVYAAHDADAFMLLVFV
jgi:hypothetical protein